MPSIIKPLMSVKDRTGWRLEEDQVERASVISAHSLSLSASPAVSCDRLGAVAAQIGRAHV